MNSKEELLSLVNFLNDCQIVPSSIHEDGRMNSVNDEKNILKIIENSYPHTFKKVPPRSWMDFYFGKNPVQYKSSSFKNKSSDNFSSKQAILYALTNLSVNEIEKVRGWYEFEYALLNYSKEENDRDYHIIVMNKDNCEFHLTSLKTLNKLTPNGNNLPFQIKWYDNIQSVKRTHQEAYKFIVSCYTESVRKKISVHKLYESL